MNEALALWAEPPTVATIFYQASIIYQLQVHYQPFLSKILYPRVSYRHHFISLSFCLRPTHALDSCRDDVVTTRMNQIYSKQIFFLNNRTLCLTIPAYVQTLFLVSGNSQNCLFFHWQFKRAWWKSCPKTPHCRHLNKTTQWNLKIQILENC